MKGLEIALTVICGVVGGVAVLWPAYIWYAVDYKCEKPKHTVVRAIGGKRTFWSGRSRAELRKYAPLVIAEVTVEGTMREVASKGFRAVASYIFGKNVAEDKIAMTTPVRMEMSGKGGGEKIAMTSPVRMEVSGAGSPDAAASEQMGPTKLSFVMPSKYTLDTLPRPLNPDVKLREMPGRLAAVLMFSGYIRGGREAVDRKAAELLALLKEEGLEAEGVVELLQYHPPLTYGWLRRNEVLVNVKET